MAMAETMLTLRRSYGKGKKQRRNNVEISSIPNSIPDEDLENTLITVCKDSGVEIDLKDIEACHRLPL